MRATNDGKRALCWERVCLQQCLKRWLLLALLLTPTLASAQANCFPHNTAYLTGNMNIRERASANSRVVATASPGDSFPILQSLRGKTWCWLKIRQGWMAKTSRVTFSPPGIAAQPTVDIDNCCFVNRHCSTDEDWQRGFWAFQNNECPLTTQNRPPASTSQIALPGNIDNCCFLDRECHSDADWITGFLDYQNKQCSVQADNISRILPSIQGDEAFRRQITRAFEYLLERSSQWFNYTVSKIHRIEGATFDNDAHYGGKIAGSVDSRSRVVKVSIEHARDTRSDIALLASTLIHEACHLHQFDSGKFSRWDWELGILPEQECYGIEAQALAEMAPGHRHIEINQCQSDTYPFTAFCGWRF